MDRGTTAGRAGRDRDRLAPSPLLADARYTIFPGDDGALILRDWTTPPTGEAFGWPLHLTP